MTGRCEKRCHPELVSGSHQKSNQKVFKLIS